MTKDLPNAAGEPPAVRPASRRAFLIATAVVALVAIRSKPLSYWEFDEPLFAQALHSYNPAAHLPPPPGYPVFIFVARLFRLVFPTDLSALVALSVVATIIGFALLTIAFGRIAGDATAGVVGALLFYLSPAMLVHSTMPVSEPGALALLAAALVFATTSPPLFAAFAALVVGWRPQFSIFVVPLFFAVLFVTRKRVLLALAVFTAICLAWLIPLTVAVGGIEKLIAFESGQARYLAQHDAEASRRGWSASSILVHFIAHSWGPRVLALPVLLAAAIGAWSLRRRALAVAVGIAGATYLVVALAVMDPADGVRYSIPFLLVVAFAAGAGVTTLCHPERSEGPGGKGGSRTEVHDRIAPLAPRSLATLGMTPWVVATAFAAGSIMYVSSFVVQRATGPSPITRAIGSVPAGSVVGYELSLWPHAQYHFRERAMRIDASMQRVFDRPEVPLFALMNGRSDVAGAQTFEWENSDAYWNLTRNLYRVISVVPFGPERRYRVIRGVHLMERESDAIRRVSFAETSPHIWMWLDADAAVETTGAIGVDLRLRLPRSIPFTENRVTVIADGRVVGSLRIKRGEESRYSVAFPAPARVVELRSDRSLIPAGDRRRVAVQLRDLVFRLPAASAKRRAA